MNLEHICQQACKITKEVGQFLRTELGKVDQDKIEQKYLNNLVSYVDKASEEQLIKGLGEILPEASFIAEEETVAQEDKDWRWIIDPLDGTTNFLHQLPFFAISIGLQHKEKTVLGIVYEVNKDELFYSWEGAPAYLNGRTIGVTGTTDLKDALLATGFPYYDFDYVDAYLKMLKPLMLGTRGLRRIGSAALDLVYVACGRFDGYFEYSLSPWDVTGGAFIAQQAGALVSDFSGGDDYIFGREIIAASPAIHKILVEMTKQHFKS
ncbi:MAG: inositol monophosphatase [Aureispira sp.]|nr:inositol monophosphatase [Aureispira sp.]